MTRAAWLDIMARAPVPQIPEASLPNRPPAPLRGLPGDATVASPAPSASIWPRTGEPVARFGVRVRTTPADPRRQIIRLAAAAIERGAEPVIISYVGRTGFEQAGFRVERIHAGTEAERAMQEAEVSRFWGLVVVIEFDDVAGLD